MGQIGGKAAPAVGWALGVERLIELLREQNLLPQPSVPDVYAVVPEGVSAASVAQACRVLRHAGCKVWMHSATEQGQGSMKSQFKRADASGAHFALIFGEDELARGVVSIKSLRTSADGVGMAQVEVGLGALASWWQQQADPLQSNV
jgi:histidyl-tRNA synthetase